MSVQRAGSLSLIAVLATAAALTGTVDGRARPAQQTPEQARKVAAQVKALGLGANVKVDLVDGRRVEGVIIDIAPSDIKVIKAGQDRAAAVTIALADIEHIRKRKGTSPAVWIALGVGIAILVPLALCAATA
jgi:hypothetical protein